MARFFPGVDRVPDQYDKIIHIRRDALVFASAATTGVSPTQTNWPEFFTTFGIDYHVMREWMNKCCDDVYMNINMGEGSCVIINGNLVVTAQMDFFFSNQLDACVFKMKFDG